VGGCLCCLTGRSSGLRAVGEDPEGRLTSRCPGGGCGLPTLLGMEEEDALPFDDSGRAVSCVVPDSLGLPGRLLAGVLGLETQTPSTSIPLSNARTPNGI